MSKETKTLKVMARDEKGHFIKGGLPWNTGTKGVKSSTSGSFKKGDNLGEKHFAWKGELAGYLSKHTWMNRTFGKPSECEGCGATKAKKFEWANISGEYKRERSDWKRLCTSCHMKMDGHAYKMWETRRSLQNV